MPLSHSPLPPAAFQKAMIFIDGTNLFYRLAAAKLKVSNLSVLLSATDLVGSRQISRTYLYTIEHHFEKAKAVHGESFCNEIRVVFGTGIPLKDGNVKEKGVDALLVADLIYHAASRNCEYTAIVTSDTDFAYALRRVEDFGCGTAVLSICCDAPEALRLGCDKHISWDKQHLLDSKLATEV